jgi:hypothetical protein
MRKLFFIRLTKLTTAVPLALITLLSLVVGFNALTSEGEASSASRMPAVAGQSRDYDGDGEDDNRWQERNCRVEKAEQVAVGADAEDVAVVGARGRLKLYQSKNLIISDSRGFFDGGKSLSARVTDFDGRLTIVTNILNSLSQVKGPVRVTALGAGQLTDLKGPLHASLDQAQAITGHRGPICLITTSMNEIIDSKGPIAIFGGTGAELQLIKDSEGSLYLENVNLGRLENHVGPIFLKNSKVFEFVNSTGRVTEL